jgi:arylsulfatase A-like enzyme
MRAIASYTAVSLSAIVTGRTQRGDRDAIANAPTMFELVRAVKAGERSPEIAYFSAQASTVFERDVKPATDRFVSLETLVGHAVDDEDSVIDEGVDRLLAARFRDELPSLRAPYFAMLHFAGTHAPYFVNDDDAPFRPYSRTVAWSKMDALHRAYQNAIHEQDKSIAACVRAFVSAQEAAGSPWMIVFTSDHGEAFGEHGAIHHGQSLYEEQIHVPAWVAFGGGALGESEARNLFAHETANVTHLDILPTILDAYGVLHAFAMRPYASALRGESLLAPVRDDRAPIAMTNCTAMFPCPLDTWGVLDGDYALEAQAWDDDWRCVRFSTGEESVRSARCDALRAASTREFPTMPNGRANR